MAESGSNATSPWSLVFMIVQRAGYRGCEAVRRPGAGRVRIANIVHPSVTSPHSLQSIGVSTTDGQRGGPEPPNAASAGCTPSHVRLVPH